MSQLAKSRNRPPQRQRPRSHAARPAPERKQPGVQPGTLLALAGTGLIAAGLLGTLVPRSSRRRPSSPVRLAAYGAGLLAASVLADSAMEHYRGNFGNRAMYAAPLASAATLAAAIATAYARGSERLRGTVFAGALLTGLVGTGFHIKNITERPGGLSFNNLFYRAPFGAPGALAISGALGLGAIAAGERGRGLLGDRDTGRALAAVTAGGLFGLTAEVGLLHFRGAFHDPFMYAPVVAVPLTGLALAAAAANPSSPDRAAVARRMLGVTTALGLIGSGFHTYGVSRNSGGFKNWTQNLFQGPPIAAPPSLAGLALGGYAALQLLARGGRQEIFHG